MPLKPDDLKTVENYKKAIKHDLARINTQGTTKFWVYKDVELPTATGSKHKFPAFISLVDDNGIRKAMTGKKLICKGTCGIKENKIAFEPTIGKVPYKHLKTSLPLLLGKAVWIPTGMEDAEDEEEAEEDGLAAARPVASSQPLAAPPPPPRAAAAQSAQAAGTQPVSAAALSGTWTKLVKDVQAYVAAHPERKADLFRDMTEISGLLKANKAAEAKPMMGKMQAALNASPGARPSGMPSPGLVKYRQALLQFARAKSEVKAQIGTLKSAIIKVRPQKADFADGLAAELEKLNDEVADAVDEAMKASKNEASPATAAVKSKIREYLAELASNPLVQEAEANPVGVKVTINKTLGVALARIQDAMPA